MEMKHYKNKIITCTILITLLLSDIGLKNNYFFLPPQSVDVLSRFIYTALWARLKYSIKKGNFLRTDALSNSTPCDNVG